MQYRIGAMHIGQILDTAFEVFRDHHKALLAITAVVFGPYMLLFFGSAFSGLWPLLKAMGVSPASSWEQLPGYYVRYVMGFVVFSLLSLGFGVFTGGAIVLSVSSRYLNAHISSSESVHFVLSRWWPLLKTVLFLSPLYLWSTIGSVLVACGIGSWMYGEAKYAMVFKIMAIMGIIMTLVASFLWGKLYLIYNVVVLEDVSGWKAIKRSMLLMKGSLWQGVFLVLFRYFLALALYGATKFITWPQLMLVVDMILKLVFFAFFVVASVVLYFSTRSKHENFDIEFMAQYATA